MEELKNCIPQVVYDALINGRVNSTNSIILKTTIELCDLTGLKEQVVDNVKLELARILLGQKFKPVSTLKEWIRLSTGVREIDKIIRGGLPANGINEIYGLSGVGKTQIGLQLSLMVQLPREFGGLNKGALYICTEDVFPTKRLQQLTKNFHERFPKLQKKIAFEDGIFIEHVADIEQLINFILNKMDNLVNSGRIGLVVIDSIASVFRCEETDFRQRSVNFRKIALKLYEVSDKEIVVLSINQVTDDVNTNSITPSLGLTWRNLVTSRFHISRHLNYRIFECKNAPDLPNQQAYFQIESSGLADIIYSK